MSSFQVTRWPRDRCAITPVLLFIILVIKYQHGVHVSAQWNNVSITNGSAFIVKPEYYNFFNGSVSVSFKLTAGDVLLLNFPKFDLYPRYYTDGFSDETCDNGYPEYRDRVSLHTPQGTVWLKCGYRDISPRLFNESWVRLTYESPGPNNPREQSSLNVTYSVLPQIEGGYRLPDGSFNCSAMDLHHRDHVNLHFRCNLAIDCADRRDEMNCSYTSDFCGPGMIDVGNFCLTSLPRKESNITWDDAESECGKHNQTLVAIGIDSNEFVDMIKRLLDVYAKNNSLVFYNGLRTSRNASRLQGLYEHLWEWSTRTTAFYLKIPESYIVWPWTDLFPACVAYIFNILLFPVRCNKAIDARVICQLPKQSSDYSNTPPIPKIAMNRTPRKQGVQMVVCPSGHQVLSFLENDTESHCSNTSKNTCTETVKDSSIQLFKCLHSLDKCVHYSLVCNGFPDCLDGTDESFCACFRDTCNRSSCKSGQYSSSYDRPCADVLQGRDLVERRFFGVYLPPVIYSPVVVDFRSDSRYDVRVNVSPNPKNCTDTHFNCSDGSCLPVYLRCNEVNDCQAHEDEATGCDADALCPGFFRCRGSNICLHPDHVCDNICQCPQGDDELMCGVQCPPGCYCRGLVFICSNSSVLKSSQYPHYLQIRQTNISHLHLSNPCLQYLVVLRILHCNMSTLSPGNIQNLMTLDLSSNKFVSVKMNTLLKLRNLRHLILSGNPLTALVAASMEEQPNTKFEKIDLSHTELSKYDGKPLEKFPYLKELNLSGSSIKSITSDDFEFTNKLESLDMEGLKLKSYPSLEGLTYLTEVWADDFKVCCSSSLPVGFHQGRCHAPEDKVASCEDLLRTNLYRTALWTMALCALVGNAGSCVVRFLLRSESFHSGFSVFVTNLSLADFLMGVYLAIVGVADSLFRGRYAHKERTWKTSAACQAAGFLSLLSSEVSAFFILLITVDRFLVLRFPFSRYHFRRRSALVASGVAWVTGVVLASVPLLSATSQWDFYSQTGLCFPLPFAREKTSDGYMYNFIVVILLNFALFLLIAAGQVAIYLSVRANSVSSDNTTARSKEAVIARRLLAVVVSDFLCWFPIGVLGVVAFLGVDISPDAGVHVAIFALPINSALNPFLYTLNVVLEKRRNAAKARMMERLQSELRQTSITHSSLSAMRQLTTWLKEGVLSPKKVVTLLKNKMMAKELVNLWLEKEARSPQEQLRSWLQEGLLSARQLATETQDEEIVQELISEWLKKEALSPREQIHSWLQEGLVSRQDLAIGTRGQEGVQEDRFSHEHIDHWLEQGRESPHTLATVEQSQEEQASMKLDKVELSQEEHIDHSLGQGRVSAQDLAKLTKTKAIAKDQISIWLRDGLLSPTELTTLTTQQSLVGQPEQEAQQGISLNEDRAALTRQSDFDESDTIVVRM